jgi:hypothetical protein
LPRIKFLELQDMPFFPIFSLFVGCAVCFRLKRNEAKRKQDFAWKRNGYEAKQAANEAKQSKKQWQFYFTFA